MKTILMAALLFTLTFHRCFAAEEAAAEAAADALEYIATEVEEKLKDPKKEFIAIVELTVKDGEGEKVIAAFAETIPQARKVDGCLRFELTRIEDEAEENTYLLCTRWENLEKMKAYLGAERTKKLLETVMPLLDDSEPDITVLIPLAEPKKAKPEAR